MPAPNHGEHTTVIAQCTDSKRDEKSPARDLYDESHYFRVQRAYAVTADAWFIQSAEHGLLAPDDAIEPYDTQPDDIADTEAWAVSIADAVESEVPSYSTIELLGGADYADPVTPELERRGFEVIEPLRGLKFGPRKSRLQVLAAEATHDTLC